MADKPTGSTEWASDAAALRIAPDANQKQWGWSTDDNTISGVPVRPNLQNQNGWQFNANALLQYMLTFMEDTPDWVDVWEAGAAALSLTAGDVDVSDNSFNVPNHGYRVGSLAFTTESSPANRPSPLVDFTSYYIIVVDDDNYRLAATVQDAFDGIAIDLTDAGGDCDWIYNNNFYITEDWNYKTLAIDSRRGFATVYLPELGSMSSEYSYREFYMYNLFLGQGARVRTSDQDYQRFPMNVYTYPQLDLTGGGDFVRLKANPNVFSAEATDLIYLWNVLDSHFTKDEYKFETFSNPTGTADFAPSDVNVTHNTIKDSFTRPKGSVIQFDPGTLPGGISDGVDYWVTPVSGQAFKISTSVQNMNNGIFVEFTDAGSGTNYFSYEHKFVVPNDAYYDYLRVDTNGNDMVLTLPASGGRSSPLTIYKLGAEEIEIEPAVGSEEIMQSSESAYLYTEGISATFTPVYTGGDWYLDNEEFKLVLVNSGSANLNGTVFLSRSGTVCRAKCNSLSHLSGTSASTSLAVLPERMTPVTGTLISTLTNFESDRVIRMDTRPDGSITWFYRDWAGATTNETNTTISSCTWSVL